MTPEQTFVDAALSSWRSNMDRVGKLFGSLTPEELELEVAPTRNRLIYIWGHLSASNDAIPPLFGFGPRRFPDLERMFVKNLDRAVTLIVNGIELKEIWTQLDVALWEEFQKLSSSDWLQRHQGVSPEDFVREQPIRKPVGENCSSGVSLRPGDPGTTKFQPTVTTKRPQNGSAS